MSMLRSIVHINCICLLCVLFLIGCASKQVSYLENQSSIDHYDDEKNLWIEVKEAQDFINRSSFIVQDQALESY